MPRRLWYPVAWAVATAVTVGVSWLGIRSVLIAAAPTRTTPLSAADLRLVAPRTSEAAEERPSERPSTSPSPSPSASPSASTLPSPSHSPSPTEAWAQSTDGRGGTGYRRIFHTVGGDISFYLARGDAQVVAIAARAGYTTNVTRYGSDSVMVSLFASHKTSRVWARWWNGPYAEVTESVP